MNMSIDLNYQPPKEFWMPGRDLYDGHIPNKDRICPDCKSDDLEFIDGFKFNETYMHITAQGKPDKRFSENPVIAQYVSYQRCLSCQTLLRVVHFHNDIIGHDTTPWMFVEIIERSPVKEDSAASGREKKLTNGTVSKSKKLWVYLIVLIIAALYIAFV